MEDLKARYYAICRRLIRSRISTDDVETRQMLLSTYAFDKQREVERKKAVARLYTRTPEQLAEEEALHVEIRRIEQNEAKYASEREELLRLLGGWESLPSRVRMRWLRRGRGLRVCWEAQTRMRQPRDAVERRGTRSASCSRWKRRVRRGRRMAVQRRTCCETFGDTDVETARRDETGAVRRDAVHRTLPLQRHRYHRFERRYHRRGRPCRHHRHCRCRRCSNSSPVRTPRRHRLHPTPDHHQPIQPVVRSRRLPPLLAHARTPTQPRAQDHTGACRGRSTRRTEVDLSTAKNVEKWENLMGAVTTSLEMRKQLERVNAELRIAKQRIAAALQQGTGKGGLETATAAAAAAAGSAEAPPSSTLGEGEGEANAEEAQTSVKLE